MYLLIVYDVTRNPWFYTIFSVSSEFSFILANIVGQFPRYVLCLLDDGCVYVVCCYARHPSHGSIFREMDKEKND